LNLVMSGGGGFLPDLASWALRGGGASSRNNSNEGGETPNGEAPPPMTAEELREQRLARMQQQMAAAAPVPASNEEDASTPMDIDETPLKGVPEDKRDIPPPKVAAATVGSPSSASKPTIKKAKKEEEISPTDRATRLQRKKEVLLKKTTQIVLQGGYTAPDSTSVVVDIDSTEISTSTIAEILASRLSADSGPLVVPYLGSCYNRVAEEINHLNSSTSSASSNAAKKQQNTELYEVLQELEKQIVSYAATCLSEPTLFPYVSLHAPIQLAQCMLKSTLLLESPTTADAYASVNLVLGGGGGSSFYSTVMDELQQQNEACVASTVHAVVEYFCKLMSSSDAQEVTVLDAGNLLSEGPLGPIPCSAMTVVTALSLVCSHSKTAGLAVASAPQFHLPPPNTADATRQIRPSMPTGSNALQQLLNNSDAHRPYLGRSGPALERHTVLGLCFKVGLPQSSNPAFPATSILRMSAASAESASRSQRQQYSLYQNVIQQLVMSLIKAGPAARQKFQDWVKDALLVNTGATAMRPDRSKVSSRALLQNLAYVLLRLCEPFLNDPKKHHLIDPGFVSSPAHHGEVFAETGDDAVPRLGGREDIDTSAMIVDNVAYNPRNAFIPFCFFYCARSLHVSIVPGLQQHENLLRHISHWHYELTSRGSDVQTDPRFASMIARQRSDEVALFHEEFVEQSLSFYCLLAKQLLGMDKAVLKTMPEDFVSDMCDLLTNLAPMKGELLRGHDFRAVFQLVVKLLSPDFATVRRRCGYVS
jgi:Ubiquitin elongating factor core